MKSEETFFRFVIDDRSVEKVRQAIRASKIVAGEAEYNPERCGSILAQIQLDDNGDFLCSGAYVPPSIAAKIRLLLDDARTMEITE